MKRNLTYKADKNLSFFIAQWVAPQAQKVCNNIFPIGQLF